MKKQNLIIFINHRKLHVRIRRRLSGLLSELFDGLLRKKQSERDVNGLLKSVGIYGKIQLFTDYDAFLKRVKGIAAPESEEVRKELEKKRYDFLVYSM